MAWGNKWVWSCGCTGGAQGWSRARAELCQGWGSQGELTFNCELLIYDPRSDRSSPETWISPGWLHHTLCRPPLFVISALSLLVSRLPLCLLF